MIGNILRDKDSQNIIRTDDIENLKLKMDSAHIADIKAGTILQNTADGAIPNADSSSKGYHPGTTYIAVNSFNAARGTISFYDGAADPINDADSLTTTKQGSIGAVNLGGFWTGCIYGNHAAAAVAFGDELTINSTSGDFAAATLGDTVVLIVTKANSDDSTKNTRWYVTSKGAGYIKA